MLKMSVPNPRPGLRICVLVSIFVVGCLATNDGQLEEDAVLSRIRRNSRSKRSVDQQQLYNITTPTISAVSWNDEVTAFGFISFGANFSIVMIRNKDLIRPGAELHRRKGYQNVTEPLAHDSHKHFLGHVIMKALDTDEELGRGIAAFTQIEGLDGSLYIDGKEIKVIPLVDGASVYDKHIVYFAEEEKEDLTSDMIRIAAVDTSGLGARKKRDLAIPEQHVELMAAIEYDLFMELGDAAIDYTLSSINSAQAIFMESSLLDYGIKIKFTVVKMVLMETQELLNTIGKYWYDDITDLFSTFAFAWERLQTGRDGGDSDLKYYDVALVVGGTSVADNGNDIGVSSFQGCHPNNHYIAIKYNSRDHTARVLARQFGHIVGMDNDNFIEGCTEEGIMSDVNVLKFTICNRLDAMTYLSSTDGACFSDAPNGTVLFEVLATEDERLDHDCYLRYAANSSFYSEEVCPWRKNYQTGDCHIWCNVVDMDLMISDCTTQGQMPTYENAACGYNRVCDEVLGCICPEGVTCNVDGDGKGLEGIDHYRVVTASTYDGARQECLAYGGHLADIRNVDIQNHLETLLDGYPEYDKFYFGLHQEESAGYILLSNEDEPTYFNWAGGEPNENNNHCIVLSRADGYQMIDYSCEEAIGAVCEIRIPTPVAYWLPQPTRQHSVAKINCELYGGRLAKIADLDTKTNIVNFLSGVPEAQTASGIYFQLQKVNGGWKFEDGHELRLWNDWMSGEPANSLFMCAVMSPSNSYQWVAENCSEFERLHLCEFECVEGASWCQNGVVTDNGGSCTCVCDAGWTGMFCRQPASTPTVRYMLSDVATNYVNATQACSALAGQLGRVLSFDMAQNLGDFVIGNGATEVLLGLHKISSLWVTDDDLPLGEYSAWLGSNPGSYNCATMRYDTSWMWLGADCTTSIQKYVCEFDCVVHTSWCVNGEVVMDAQEGCYCQCYYTWTGPFCSERVDVMYWLNPVSVDGYDDAFDKCSAKFGRLAVIHNAATQSVVENFLGGITLSNSKLYFDIHKVDGKWINADGEQVYQHWAYSFRDEHDCAYVNEDKGYKWTPGICTWGNGRLSLCEFDCTHSDWCQHGTVVGSGGTCSCMCDEFWEGMFCEISAPTTLTPTAIPVSATTTLTPTTTPVSATTTLTPTTTPVSATTTLTPTTTPVSATTTLSPTTTPVSAPTTLTPTTTPVSATTTLTPTTTPVFTDIMYWVNPLPVSGLTANDECVAMGGRLSAVPNLGTQQAIGAFISAQTVPDDRLYFDLRKENDVWVNSAGQQDFFDWCLTVDPADDCAVLRKDKDYGFQSQPCTAAFGRRSICEFDCSNGTSWCRNGGQVTVDPVNGYCSCACAAGWKGPFCLQLDTPPTVRYRLSSAPADYTTARDSCEYFGGELARMQSPEMFQNLLAFINTTGETELLVGLHKINGVWMADDSNQQGGYTLWNKNVANNPDGKECAYVSTTDGVVEWYMTDCSVESRKYVCEFDCSSGSWVLNGQVVADEERGCSSVCSQGWTGEFCEVRNDIHYWLNPSPVSGTDAAVGCVYHGGRLAVSPNPGTNNMIGEFLDQQVTTYTKFHFDLKRVNGVWVNQDGDQDYFNWAFAVDETYECSTLRSDRDYGWQAIPCSWANRLSVCEFDCSVNTSWCNHGTVMTLSRGCKCACSYAWAGEFCNIPLTAKALWVPQGLFAWNQAKENCEMYGGRLLNVDSANSQARATAYLQETGASPASGDFFTGIRKVDGAWVYYDGDVPIQFTNWTDGEPLASGYNCVSLKIQEGYMWVTENCSKSWGNAHVCEFDCIVGASWCHNGDVVIDTDSGTCSCVCNTGWHGKFCLEPVTVPTVRYRLSTDATDYADSEQACLESGGRLARILTQQQEQSIISYLGNTTATDVLFGLHKVNGVWMYDIDTQQSGYTNWHKNIGNSAKKTKECTFISLNAGIWEWSMVKCSSTARKHLCEFDCDPSANWCYKGVIEMDSTEGCKCTCNNGWTGEFCEVRSDIMYWLNPNIVKGTEAPGECAALHGRLAPSLNKGTQAAIESFLQTQTPSNVKIYIGLRKEEMVWVNDFGPQEYFKWLWDVEVNDTCAAIRIDREYKWQPRQCTFGNSLSLCEFECFNQTDWCGNGVVTTHEIGCECTCNAGWTGTFCDVPLAKKRSIRSVTEQPEPSAVSDSISTAGGSSADSGDNASEDGKYFYGIYRSKEANKYDYVYPECETYDSGIHKNCLMKAFGCEFYFNLTENIELIVPSAKIVRFKSEESYTAEFIKPKNCHFMGPVTRRCGIASVTESHGRAAVSPCGSMGGSLFFDDMRYNILPLESNSREFRGTYMLVENPERENPLIIDIFRAEDLQEAGRPQKQGQDRHSGHRLNRKLTKPRRNRRLRRRKKKPEVDGRREIHLELMLTVNYDVYKEYGEDSAMFAVTLINNVQAVYQHESLYEYGIHVILHVINVQILEEPILENAFNVQRWADIGDIYMAYKSTWEPHFWNEDDKHSEHYDVAILLAGSSVVDTRDDTGLSTFQSCNTEPCSVVKLSSFEGARGTIAHEIGLMMGMYYDQLDPNCHELQTVAKTSKGIMINADRVFFTECNRRDLLTYVNKPFITCFDDAPIPGDWQTILTYPLQADVICKTLFENNDEYYSERSCPWRKPELTGDCELWCEYVEIATGRKGCARQNGAIPLNSEVPCGPNKVCNAKECVCRDGVSCVSKRQEEPVSPAYYKIIHSSHLSWNEASHVCLEMNGEPVTIPNEATRLALVDLIKARPGHDKFFLGFRRNSSDSNEWLTSFDETVTFFDWAESEPNENDNECAVLSRNNNYKWSDHSCDGGASSICMFSCDDDFWCSHGNVTINGDTCTCECFSGWTGEICDEFVNTLASRYVMSDHKMNYFEAKNYCEERYGNLPSARDITKYSHFTTFLESTEHATEDFYLDLELDMYIWRDSHSKAPHIAKWIPGEPQQGKVCTLASGTNSYNWISSNCSEELYVVCDFPCQKSHEKWCRQGDLVDNGEGVCECVCWPGSYGVFCEKYDYQDVIYKGILFYEAQRSGILPPSNRIPWRGDSALNDEGLWGEDLTGGWYDAGDHVKFSMSHTNNLWKLMLGLYEFKEAYAAAGELENMYDCVKWGLDYVLKCHTAPHEFYAVVGDPYIDHNYWGRPEEMQMERPVLLLDTNHTGSDIAGNAAASLALGYLVFQEIDPVYAATLLSHARELYDFANTSRGTWSDGVYPELYEFYRSSSYFDELTNAAVCMYRATGEQGYLEDAKGHYNEFGMDKTNVQFSWSTITSGMQITMYLTTNNATYLEPVVNFFEHWYPEGDTYYTPKGLAWKNQFQPLKHTSNVAFLATICAKYGINVQRNVEWARSQIHYILGDSGRSYLSGFGKDPPQRVHHRASSCPDPPEKCTWDHLHLTTPNPQPLLGALVGGPDKMDNFDDSRGNWAQNEAGIYGSGFLSAVAGLKYLEDRGI